MSKSRTWVSWATLAGVVAAVELVSRFWLRLSFRQVLVVETILFLAAALATAALLRRPPHLAGWRRGLQWSLVWAFVLAAVRAAIWAAGQPVARANLVILLLGIGVAIGSRIRCRRQQVAQISAGGQ